MAKRVALIDECDVAYAMSMLGGKWKIAIIWKLFGRTYRFGELKRQLPGVAEGVLVTQLKELVRDGLVLRHSLDNVPPHVEYTVAPVLEGLEPAASTAIPSEPSNWTGHTKSSLLPSR